MDEVNEEDKKLNYITSLINDYVKLTDEIKTLNKHVKERRVKLKLAIDSILAYIDDNEDIERITLTGTDKVIEPIQKTTVKGTNYKSLYSIVQNELKDNKVLMDKIDSLIAEKQQNVTQKTIKIRNNKKTSTKMNKILNESAEADSLLSNL